MFSFKYHSSLLWYLNELILLFLPKSYINNTYYVKIPLKMFFFVVVQVNWIHRTSYGSIGQASGTIISVDNKIHIDESLNRVQDGNHKYDIVVTSSGETNTYMLIIRRLELKDAGIYTCKVLVQGQSQDTHPSKDGKMVVLCK